MTEGELRRPSNSSNHSRERLKNLFNKSVHDSSIGTAKDDMYHKSFFSGSSFTNRRTLFIILGIISIISFLALFYHSDQVLSNSMQQIRIASKITSLTARIESGVLALNTDSGNFISNEDLRFAKIYKTRAGALTQDLKLLIDEPAALDFQKTATTLNDGIAQHVSQFAYIVKIQTLLGVNNNIGITANAATSLASLEKNIRVLSPQFKDRVAIDYLNQIKIAEMHLRLKPGIKKIQTVRDTISSLNKTILSSSLPNLKKKLLVKLLQSHKSDITQLARTRMTYLEEIKQLEKINIYAGLNLNKLRIYAGNFSLLVQQNSRASQNFILQILSSGGSVIILVLMLCGIILVSSIIRPVSRTIETAMELARGNIVAPIPYLGNSDETGELSRSLTFFRQNMLHADRLRKDLEGALNQEAILNIAATGTQHDEHKENINGVTKISNSIHGKTAITEIGHQLTTISRSASDAAEEAERTETIVSGLDDAKDKIEDIEKLMVGINDQMSLLSVQTTLHDTEDSDTENLIHLDEKRDKNKFASKIAKGQTISDRIETIQGGTKRAIKAAQTINVTINEVNEVAKEFSTTASKEALVAANELLRQSKELRTMLDGLLDRVDREDSVLSESKTNN
jgi:methyl-accepting chemotaxis protein